MSSRDEGGAAIKRKTAELVVALLFALGGAVVVWDSLRQGAKWGEDGPQAGYFPFYVGLTICISAALTFFKALTIRPERDTTFVEVGQLRLVLAVLVPTAAYVALIGWIGIYVASILFIAYFMRRLGGYAWWKVAAVSIGNSVFFFVVFEYWFTISLPKGPLEHLLRLN